jgi:hypothetical protein
MSAPRNLAFRLLVITTLTMLLFVRVPLALGDSTSTQSYTGTLATSESVFQTTVTLTAGQDLLLQTYGFGGGTNAAGMGIAAGGTDDFVGVFDSTGQILTYPTGDPANPGVYGTSLGLSNYGSFTGCPPAGTVNYGGTAVCGDVTMTIDALAAGTYTIVLSDGSYVPYAVGDLTNLSEGFSDFTGGQFCNIYVDSNGDACTSTSGAYALDVTTITPTVATPEPAGLLLLVLGLLALGVIRNFRGKLHNAPHFG